MRLLDANIFLRFLVEPQSKADRQKANACKDLFQRLQSGEETATTTEAIITEVAYVLRSRSHYGLAPADIAVRMKPLLTIPGLKLTHKRVYLRALDLWVAYPRLDFEDALLVAHMERLGLGEITSYDTDFDGISSVRRIEP